jgi:hypothetical protein
MHKFIMALAMGSLLAGTACTSEEKSADSPADDKGKEEQPAVAGPAFEAVDGVNYAVNDGKAGEVGVGDPISKLEEVFGKDAVKVNKGSHGSQSYSVFLGKGSNASLEVVPTCDGSGCVIGEIMVADPGFHTGSNIRVGSMLSDIYKVHNGLNVSDENGRLILYCQELNHVAFVLDRTNVGPGISLESMAGHTPVVALYLY